MTARADSSTPFVLAASAVPGPEADAVLDEAVVATADVGVVEVTGPGTVQCVQGLLTNDVERAGTAGLIYGAVLTPKGMIICDLWAIRDGGKFLMFPPRHGLQALLDVFEHSLPPRLAKFADRSEAFAVLRLAGPSTLDRARAAGIEVPPAGRTLTAIVGEAACIVARPDDEVPPPFELQLLVPASEAAGVCERLNAAGVTTGSAAALELARVLRGWPRLGAEIDDRTLPQEVRFDELGGVSYTKGCYTGQETVARVHFRGHPNRHLAGLVWDEPPDLDRSDVLQDGKARGRVTSIAWLGPVERYVGLAVVRREVDRERTVQAAGAMAALQHLPFNVDG